MSCWWSQCTGVTGGVMQIMAAIMTVGALCARWSVVEENGDSHLFASEVHVGGVSSQSWAEVVTQSCNDDTSDLCSAAKSAKTTFGALFFVGCVLCAVDIVLWFIGDLAWKFQDINWVTRFGRRKMGYITAIGAVVCAVARIILLIVAWSDANGFSNAVVDASADSSTKLSVPSIETAEGIMILAIFFNVWAVGLDFYSLVLHTREQNQSAKGVGLDATLSYQLHA